MTFDPIQPDWTRVGAYWFELFDQTPRDHLYAGLRIPDVGTPMSDDGAMFLALVVALMGVGNVSPNPLVGAVLLDKNGGFLSAGAHLRVGKSHAEVNAIRRAAQFSDLVGASLFVTLEPCAHEGRTPSCAKLIAATGISRVLFGMRDPNPLVNGEGERIVRKAGKSVDCLEAWSERCQFLARAFTRNQVARDVFTAIKVASTPSGVIAGKDSSRLWITGERARNMGHFLRLEYDAIAVGIRTVLLDNPTLNIRHPAVEGRTPMRVVLDPRGELLSCQMALNLLNIQPEKTLVILPRGLDVTPLLSRHSVGVVQLELDAVGHFNWADIKKSLLERGLYSLLIEGGAGLYHSAVQSGEVDLVHWFVAPEMGLKGLTWQVIPQLAEIYKNGGGVPLGEDRLLEISLR